MLLTRRNLLSSVAIGTLLISFPAKALLHGIIPASLFATNGCWTWFNDQRSVYSSSNGSIYSGWIDNAGNIFIGRYFISDKKLQISQIDIGSNVGIDDHNNPAILILDTNGPNPGQILVTYSQHGGKSYSQVSQIAGSIYMGDIVTVDSANAAYTHTTQAADVNYTVFNFYRRYTGAADSYHSFKSSTDGGNTWSAQIPLFSNSANGGHKPYFQIKKTNTSRFDFFCTDGHPSEDSVANVSIYHFYMSVLSDSTFKLFTSSDSEIGHFNADGTTITGATLPLVPTQVTKVYDAVANNNSSWVWDLTTVGGNICGMFATFNTTPDGTANGLHYYYKATLSAGSWSYELVCSGGPYQTGPSGNAIYAAQITYSGGMCLDPNDATSIYASRKYGLSDFRIEKWTKTGGVWKQGSNLSGGSLGQINARPHWVQDYPTTQLLFWSGSYTSYLIYNTNILVFPPLPITSYVSRTKPSSPSWQAGSAPLGATGYWGLTEGSGTTVTDFKPSGKNGSFTGTPTWGTGSYGPELSGWSTSNYVAIDPNPQLLGLTSYPNWFAVMIKNTNSSTDGYPFSQGRSADNNPIIGIHTNASNTPNLLGLVARDNEGGTDAPTPENVINTSMSDGNYHVVHWVRMSNTEFRMFVDGGEVLRGFSAETQDFSSELLLSLGVLRRNTIASPFTGTIVAAAAGAGTVIDPWTLSNDWLSGVFSAIRP